MSRIAKKLIPIPEKTELSVSGNVLNVKGTLGAVSKEIPTDIEIKITDGNVSVMPRGDIENIALWGTWYSHVKNMIAGVNKAYEKKLIVEGIGFKSDVKGKELVLALGFSHPIKVFIPEGLKVTAEKNIIAVSGLDKDKVGQFVARIKSFKKPEPYKGKGIRYDNEVIRRKQGKKAA